MSTKAFDFHEVGEVVLVQIIMAIVATPNNKHYKPSSTGAIHRAVSPTSRN